MHNSRWERGKGKERRNEGRKQPLYCSSPLPPSSNPREKFLPSDIRADFPDLFFWYFFLLHESDSFPRRWIEIERETFKGYTVSLLFFESEREKEYGRGREEGDILIRRRVDEHGILWLRRGSQSLYSLPPIRPTAPPPLLPKPSRGVGGGDMAAHISVGRGSGGAGGGGAAATKTSIHNMPDSAFKLTPNELEQITDVFKQYEVDPNEATMYPRVSEQQIRKAYQHLMHRTLVTLLQMFLVQV